jgi:hypothetical protein
MKIGDFVNYKSNQNVSLDKCNFTGYFDDVGHDIDPMKFPLKAADREHGEPRLNYVTVWLYIITDNFLHLSINFLALKYLA